MRPLFALTFLLPQTRRHFLQPSRRLEDLSWTDIRDHLASGTRTAIIMTASMEQHGPHLPTMTDTAIGYAVGDRVAALLGDALLAPVIRPGCSDHHLAFPGSLSIPEPVFIDTVLACVRSLAPQGFTRFLLLSSHGGNFGALEIAAAQLRAEFAATTVNVVAFAGRQSLMDMMRVQDDAARSHGIVQEVDALHADLTETSVMLARHGALVHPEPWERGAMGHIDTSALFAHGIKGITENGIVGDPHGATAALGEVVVEALAQHLATWARARFASNA
ncbi:MAG: creatininase family protein [Gemmatimonadaceae bacterium]